MSLRRARSDIPKTARYLLSGLQNRLHRDSGSGIRCADLWNNVNGASASSSSTALPYRSTTISLCKCGGCFSRRSSRLSMQISICVLPKPTRNLFTLTAGYVIAGFPVERRINIGFGYRTVRLSNLWFSTYGYFMLISLDFTS